MSPNLDYILQDWSEPRISLTVLIRSNQNQRGPEIREHFIKQISFHFLIRVAQVAVLRLTGLPD